MTTDDLRVAARLTVLFSTLYGVTFLNILVNKKRHYYRAKAKKETFDRYNSVEMLAADRLQANFLEWSPTFLGLLWSLAATGNLVNNSSRQAAWMYLGLRLLYVILVLRHGVQTTGTQTHLWISTFPGYGCLLVMSYHAYRELFFT